MTGSQASAATLLAGLAGAAAACGAGELVRSLVGTLVGRASARRSEDRRPLRPGAGRTLRHIARLVSSAPTLHGLSPPGELQRRLAAAGEPAGLGLREWLVVKALFAAVAGLVAAMVGAGSPVRLQFLFVVAAAGGGFLAPDLWLSRVARKRIGAAVRELPDMLDLLRVTTDAGMAPARALGVVAREFRGPLAREWTRVSTEIALGVPEDQALVGLGERLPAEEVRVFVQSLARAARHGVPLGRLLTAAAALAREGRRRWVREQAAQAGPKIQLVVALLLVPAVLLLVAAGLVAELQRSGLFAPL